MRNSFRPLVVSSLFMLVSSSLALPCAADPSVDEPAKLQNASRLSGSVQKNIGSANHDGRLHHLLSGSQHRISLYADDKQPNSKDVLKALGYLDLFNCMGVNPAFKPKPVSKSEQVSTARTGAGMAPLVVKPETAVMTQGSIEGLSAHAKSFDSASPPMLRPEIK